MKEVPSQEVEAFIAAAHRIARYGLVVCSSGNLSARLDRETMLISASGAWLEELSEHDLAICRLADCVPLDDKRPSIEAGFHAGILRERRDVNVVLHFQSLHATAIACRQQPVADFNLIPEVPYYTGAVATVPYRDPGTPALAESVVTAMRDHDLVVIRNHGQVVVGRDYRQAIQSAMFFELACGILLHGGDQVQSISAEGIAYLEQARMNQKQ